MKNILEEIVEKKKKSILLQKEKVPLKEMAANLKDLKPVSSLIQAIRVPGQVSIIAEMKQASPSAGQILKDYEPSKIAKVYEASGASALSVLTEENYFHGSLKDMKEARGASSLPVLRKDFIIDEYQIYESKLAGASAVLLILKILSAKKYLEFIKLCGSLNLDALVEIQTEQELESALKGNPGLIGINNRNLKTLTTDINTTIQLIKKVPAGIPVVSESGIKSPETIRALKSLGISAALIGESILKSKDAKQLLSSFVNAGKKL